MRFRVEWLQSALDELTTAWTEADSATRQEITSAAHQIDFELQSNPYRFGETRAEGRRVHFVYPLALAFRVELDEQTVTVLHVWRFFRHSK
jgi:hypothetical protein